MIKNEEVDLVLVELRSLVNTAPQWEINKVSQTLAEAMFIQDSEHPKEQSYRPVFIHHADIQIWGDKNNLEIA